MDKNLPLLSQELGVPKRVGPTSIAFFSPSLQSLGPKHEQSHMNCAAECLSIFAIFQYSISSKGRVKYQEDSKKGAAQENSPMKLFTNFEAQPQAAQTCIRLKTANHRLYELNYV